MARRPKVSVITCVYNGERFLRQAIESVLGQRFADFEYWIVNDGSTDGSRDVVASYLGDSRVRLLDTGCNIGAYAAANLALVRAEGELVARMDADDLSLPHRLERQVEFLDDHPDVGLLGTAYRFIDAAGSPVPRVEPLITRPQEIRWTLLFQNCIAHSTAMYRRGLAAALGFYAAGRYAQDYDLWSRMSFAAQAAQLPSVCVQYRLGSSGLTARSFDVQQAAAHDVSRRALARLLRREDGDAEVTEFVDRRSRIETCSIADVKQAHRFVVSLVEPFCHRFGYTGQDRDRVAALAREHVFWMVRWKETETPRWALSVYCRLIAANLQPRSYRRLLPAIGKLMIGPTLVRRVRRVRSRAPETPTRSGAEL